jgi:hypothetical protein
MLARALVALSLLLCCGTGVNAQTKTTTCADVGGGKNNAPDGVRVGAEYPLLVLPPFHLGVSLTRPVHTIHRTVRCRSSTWRTYWLC